MEFGECLRAVGKITPFVDCFFAVLEVTLSVGAAIIGAEEPGPLATENFLWTLAKAAKDCLAEAFIVSLAVEIAIDAIAAAIDCFPFFKELFNVLVAGAKDPNEKIGAPGSGPERWTSGAEPLGYTVFFENLATATAPAQVVEITDQLDTTNLDLSTFSFGPIGFGDQRVEPLPGRTELMTEIDLRPDEDLIVRVDAQLNPITGLVTWSCKSVDPATGMPPADPLAGFLPPNVMPPEGDGNVSFTILPKPDLVTGTEMRNRASIVFDTNPPIETNEWLNTIDNLAPASQVAAMAPHQISSDFPVSWSGSDQGSGINDYDVFVSEDGGPFSRWLYNTTATTATYEGEAGRSYAFYSVARDRTGNLESAPALADASTSVVEPGALGPAWTFRGTAQGGEVSVVIAGPGGSCTVTLTTAPGQTAAMVAENLAAAISADPCLSAQGIGAVASGRMLYVLGPASVGETTITDPGLSHFSESIPTLTEWGSMLLVLALMAAGIAYARRRSRWAGPGENV